MDWSHYYYVVWEEDFTMKSLLKNIVFGILRPFGISLVRTSALTDFYLHEYKAYEDYRHVQIFYNKQKIDRVWADEKTLDRVADIVLKAFKSKRKITGICHGTRNGFEQKYLRGAAPKIKALGTDISETASDYDNSVQWDFHDVNQEWVGTQNFIYTNSLDQSWQPKVAVETWLAQLTQDGVLIIEHTETHGPGQASEMDPFGVRPTVMPYILTMWFGNQITIEHSIDTKSNNGIDAWLFVVRKNVQNVVARES